MKITALLPMKEISERVKNKNTRKFGEKKLFEHILSSLLSSKFIDEIIINTDSQNIAEILNKKYKNIIIHNRPEEICGNYVSMNKIIEFDINNSNSDVYIQTHATNPLLKASTIDRAINFFLKNTDQYDSIFSVTEIKKRFYDEDMNPYNHDADMLTTQHLSPLFEENSSFYIFTKDSFKSNLNNRIGKNPGMFKLDKIESFDIDDEDDFFISESIYKNLKK